jgi:cell wall-associated NlpC family hydrolase
VTDSANQARSQAWSLWTKLTAPALLRCPVLGISVVLVVSTPFAAAARTLPGTQESASAEPTQRQLRVLRSYERYQARMRVQSIKASRAVRFAYRQVGKPYRWGGAGPRSYDCSGLVMAAWRQGGLRLPHRADLQHRMIRRKVGLKNLRPGDLVFFSGDHHVGIYVGDRHFLHAPHTGARVQRGTLTGWRLRAFAGAARPGAPAYHAWPHWVRALADRDLGHGAKHNPGGERQPAFEPDTTRPDDASPIDTPPSDAIPEPGDGADDQATGTDADLAQPSLAAAVPPSAAPAGSSAGPSAEPARPAPSATPLPSASPLPSPTAKAPTARPSALAGAGRSASPYAMARRPSAYGPQGLAFSLLNMAAHAPRRRHHAVMADGTPTPPPGAQAGPQRPRRHGPHSVVRQRNDEQRFDRDYDDSSASDNGGDSGDDGIDLPSLLGDTP